MKTGDGALRGSHRLFAGIGLMRFIPDLCCFTGVRLEVSIEIKPMRHVAPNPRLFSVFGCAGCLPIGPIVVPFGDSYLESYKVIPQRNYYGAPMGKLAYSTLAGVLNPEALDFLLSGLRLKDYITAHAYISTEFLVWLYKN